MARQPRMALSIVADRLPVKPIHRPIERFEQWFESAVVPVAGSLAAIRSRHSRWEQWHVLEIVEILDVTTIHDGTWCLVFHGLKRLDQHIDDRITAVDILRRPVPRLYCG